MILKRQDASLHYFLNEFPEKKEKAEKRNNFYPQIITSY